MPSHTNRNGLIPYSRNTKGSDLVRHTDLFQEEFEYKCAQQRCPRMEGPNHSTNQHRRSSTMVTSKARRHPISLANHRPCLLRCVLHWSIPQSNRVQRQRCPGSPFHQHLPRKRDAHARSVFVPTSHLFPGACPLLHYLLAEAPQVRQKAEKKLPTQGASEDSRVLDVLPVACEDTHLLVRSDP